jgi:hypothetical protein
MAKKVLSVARKKKALKTCFLLQKFLRSLNEVLLKTYKDGRNSKAPTFQSQMKFAVFSYIIGSI